MNQLLQTPEVIEALAAAVIAILALIAALAGLLVKKLKALESTTESTNTQVTNNHQSNLRDDVTDVGKQVEALAITVNRLTDTTHEGFRRMDHQFGEVHDRVERVDKDRQALSARVDQDRDLMMSFHKTERRK